MPVVIVLRVGVLAVSQMQIWIRFVGASLRFTSPRCMRVRLEAAPLDARRARGGFGRSAKALWNLLVNHAKKVQGRDWRHSWTAMSFSASWLQKLSIAMGKAEAVATLRRTPLCSRQRVLGSGESGDGAEYESWAEGRSAAGYEG